jgi:hypothetical protein
MDSVQVACRGHGKGVQRDSRKFVSPEREVWKLLLTSEAPGGGMQAQSNREQSTSNSDTSERERRVGACRMRSDGEMNSCRTWRCL